MPTRIALITDAVRAAESRWRADLDAHIGDREGKDRLRAVESRRGFGRPRRSFTVPACTHRWAIQDDLR
ncbi:hypothetical protein ACIHFC_18830 [Streptomyces sp. NPDC052013]|uniref:hypothetical protein n=1 Tax=Streptomyces sp. NPDC052013 TaxID=3365679 RepID=UPI0037CF866F